MLLRSRNSVGAVLGAIIWLLTTHVAAAQEAQDTDTPQTAEKIEESLKVKFVRGPAKCPIGAIAEIEVPPKYGYLDSVGARKLLEAMQNPTSGSELGLMGPLDLDWFLIFEFSSIGYVKDDEKDALDADAMLEALKEGNDQTNEERKKRGWTEVTLVGWEIKPRYNVLTKNLEWATRASSDSGVSINKNTRYLGRRGVMELTLVSDPKTFGQADAAAAEILKGFRFNTENEYAAFRKGDKIAEIGLTALVTGGAAAAALKMGFFKKFWKFLVIGAVAVAAAVKRILFGKKDPQSSRA